MIEWLYNSLYLEHKELLFIISVIVIIMIIIFTFYLVNKELKNDSK